MYEILIFWTADKYTKVEMIFPVKWTTWAVEKEPEKIQAWPGIKPTDLCNDCTQHSKCIHCNANQGNWRAGYCEFVIILDGGNDMKGNYIKWFIFWTVYIKCMKVGMILAVKRTTYAVENKLETWSYITLQFKIPVISYISFQVISTIRYIVCVKKWKRSWWN